MQFPTRDLTNQYISKSYQDVLQQHLQPAQLYILDGLGNVVFSIPSASIGSIIITSDVTSSMTVATASYATTASHASEVERLTNSGLSIPKYDYSYVEYTGPLNQVSTCSYRMGGASGSLVARVVALYNGTTYTGITSSIF